MKDYTEMAFWLLILKYVVIGAVLGGAGTIALYHLLEWILK